MFRGSIYNIIPPSRQSAITWCSHDPVVWPRDQVGRLPGKFKTFTKCFLMDMLEHTLESRYVVMIELWSRSVDETT